jgi:hypothetical protein
VQLVLLQQMAGRARQSSSTFSPATHDRYHVLASWLTPVGFTESEYFDGLLAHRLVHGFADTFGPIFTFMCILSDRRNRDLAILPELQCMLNLKYMYQSAVIVNYLCMSLSQWQTWQGQHEVTILQSY